MHNYSHLQELFQEYNEAKSSDPENPKEIQIHVDVISLKVARFAVFSYLYGQALTPQLPEDINSTTFQQLSMEVAQSSDTEMSGTEYSK